MRAVAMLGAGLLALGACEDALDQRLAILEEPRALAITASPAEGKPGTAVHYELLYAGPDGPITIAPDWTFCHAPKAPTEDNSVSEVCIGKSALIFIGVGAAVDAILPTDACLVYGPETKPGGFRPRDPDPTGGYYQPVRVGLGVGTAGTDGLAIALSRITCMLGNVAPEISQRYATEYVANTNPVLDAFTTTPATLAADTDVELDAAWTAASAERYLYYDPLAQALVTRRESMRVSWFATGGAMQVDATLVGEDDLATSARTTWHTPLLAGSYWLFVVLRDSRGGVTTRSVNVEVH